MTATMQRDSRYADYAIWTAEAEQAGKAAAAAAVPEPMTVVQRADPLDDASPVTRAWYVSEGVCGMAWVTLANGRSSYARWAKRNAGYQTSSYMGVYLWVSEGGQSYERKMAYATAYAKTLTAHGVTAYAAGRLD